MVNSKTTFFIHYFSDKKIFTPTLRALKILSEIVFDSYYIFWVISETDTLLACSVYTGISPFLSPIRRHMYVFMYVHKYKLKHNKVL